jgi:uncharacterized protein YcbK (DUF882 family)
MGDLSKHFSRHEHACNCGCGFDTVDTELNFVLQVDLRYHYNKAVTIDSGCRCPAWNKEEEGAEDSQHLWGKAADVRVADTSPLAVYTYLNEIYPDKYGLGLYNNFTHIDVRPDKARWNRET